MAYAAVVSLKNTIKRLLKSSHISLVSPSQEIIEFANLEAQSLQDVLKRLDRSSKSKSRKRVNALDGKISEAVRELEDAIESHVSNQIVAQSEESINGDETHHPLLFSVDLQDLEQVVDSFAEKAKKMEEEYMKEIDDLLTEEEEDDDDYAVSSCIDFGGNKSKMVGFSDEFRRMIYWLTDDWCWQYGPLFQVFSLIGMAGIGKTTLATEIFEDPSILSHFNCRAWARVGRKCQLKEIPRVILAQVNPKSHEMLMERDEKIGEYLKESLEDKRYLIVLDDVWDSKVWLYLESFFPKENRSGVLITTRLKEVARVTRGLCLKMQLLKKEESWDLLREKVFGEELCPPQLEKAGKKIAENCEGLPLTIVTLANLLSKAEKTPEYWNKVAEKRNSLFVDAYNEISKVLYPSYEYLPQSLKTCFLFMGVFPQSYEIPRSKLTNMWIAEGFLEPNIFQTTEDYAIKCLVELVSNNVVIIHQNRIIWPYDTKTCGLHSTFWHLCNKEAEKNKFFHVLNSRNDGLDGVIKGQRRLCIHNNTLFGIEDVYNSLEDDCASTIRSLMCYGPYHQYPVPLCFGLKLRLLDALEIRFFEFPMEILKLFQLRYLALTCNEELPATISKLWNLQCLIVRRHLSIKSSGAPSYLPMEIWDMKELKHIQIMGSDLPDSCGSLLLNLSTLLDVSSHSCTKGVLERIINLKKLGIRIELVPDVVEPLRCFDHVSHLYKLQSLKCVVVNPELVSPLAPPPMFPSSLQKLHLSGLGYPWEYMSIIGWLPKLEVLKLQHYAFRGPKWEIKEKQFKRLSILLIEDTDLVVLKVGRAGLPILKCLSFKHCYTLEGFHLEITPHLEKVEAVDCNPSFVTWLKQTNEDDLRMWGIDQPRVYIHSSCDDGNLKS